MNFFFERFSLRWLALPLTSWGPTKRLPGGVDWVRLVSIAIIDSPRRWLEAQNGGGRCEDDSKAGEDFQVLLLVSVRVQ